MNSVASELGELAGCVARAAAPRYGEQRLTELAVLEGGHSGLTHVATFAGPEGRGRCVIKSAPPGRPPKGRHDVLRQARILRALGAWGGVPAPEVLFWTEAPIPLFGMSLVHGFAAEPVMEDPRPDERSDLVARAWRGAVDLLRAMHRAAPADLDLEDEPVITPAQELERWIATMRAGRLDADARACELVDRLQAAVPEALAPRLVHGDFRLGNMLQVDGEIRALVDWEIWSLGDPRSDLGWLAIFTNAGNFPGFGREVAGTPTADEVVERYGEGAGVAWFRALACFKLAAIQSHNLRRHLEGRYHDPHQERLVESTRALVEHGLALVG